MYFVIISEALVSLLYCLVKKCPTVCNTNHFVVLLAAYGATLSTSGKTHYQSWIKKCFLICVFVFDLKSYFVLQIKSCCCFYRNMKKIKSACLNFSELIIYIFTYFFLLTLVTALFWLCSWCWVFICRSFLWGPAAVEHHKTRKSLGASLWKQPSSNDVLALLNPDVMIQTILKFPQKRTIFPQVHILSHPFFFLILHF